MVAPLRRTNISVLTQVNQESTLKLQTDITDDAGDAIAPIAFQWTLTDRDGNVINSLLDQSETPASTVTIVLAGDDLQIVDETKEREYRLVTIETDQGDLALPLTIEARFWVINLTKIT